MWQEFRGKVAASIGQKSAVVDLGMDRGI